MAQPVRILGVVALLGVLPATAMASLAARGARSPAAPAAQAVARPATTSPDGAVRAPADEGRTAARGSSAGPRPARRPAAAAEAAREGTRPESRGRRSAPRPLLVRVRSSRSVAVRARPGGCVIERLSASTEFGSRRVLAAVRTNGRWLGVASTARSDGRLGWVDRRSSALRAAPAPLSLHADLSRRRVELRRDGKVAARVRVAIGRPGSITPTGHFAVTDKLDGEKLSPYYGCCVLALSGTQPKLTAGWTGGNRLAIRGTNDPDSIGQASSAGCLRAADSDLRSLMRRVPVGTPIEIRD